MKKILSLIFCFALILTFVSSANTNDTVTVSNNMCSEDIKHATSQKEYYLILLDDMAKNDKKYDEDDTTEEKLEINSARHKKWLKALRDIYGTLKADLPDDSMAKLEKEELKWIKDSKKEAEDASKRYTDKDVRDVIYLDHLTDSIQHRCFELVNNYMPN